MLIVYISIVIQKYSDYNYYNENDYYDDLSWASQFYFDNDSWTWWASEDGTDWYETDWHEEDDEESVTTL